MQTYSDITVTCSQRFNRLGGIEHKISRLSTMKQTTFLHVTSAELGLGFEPHGGRLAFFSLFVVFWFCYCVIRVEYTGDQMKYNIFTC